MPSSGPSAGQASYKPCNALHIMTLQVMKKKVVPKDTVHCKSMKKDIAREVSVNSQQL